MYPYFAQLDFVSFYKWSEKIRKSRISLELDCNEISYWHAGASSEYKYGSILDSYFR